MEDEASEKLISVETNIDNNAAGINGHTRNGLSYQNRRYDQSSSKRRHRILVTILVASLLGNFLLCVLLYSGSSSGQHPSFEPCPEAPTACQHIDDFTVPPPESNEKQQILAQQNFPENRLELESPDLECPQSATVPLCSREHLNLKKMKSDAQGYDNIFRDLTAPEIKAVYDYLKEKTDLDIQPYGSISGSHIYGIELHVPNKTVAKLYLQQNGDRPPREAQVVIERPWLQPVPIVEEFIVGPLPSPVYHYHNPRRRNVTIPYRFHPSYGVNASYVGLAREMPPAFRSVIRQSYGADFTNCGHQCVVFLPQKTSSAYFDHMLIVLTAYYAADFVTIHPLDLMFVMEETEIRVYASLSSKTNTHHKTILPKFAPGERSVSGTMDMRGRKFPAMPQQGPVQYEPDGKRYIIEQQHVKYMEWSFNLRMSTASGPQVWDVQWAGEVIAHEISLQDVAVIYAGANPTTYYAHLSDSAFGLGDKAVGLMPGVDCPDHATFLSNIVYDQTEDGPVEHPNAFCVFEHNSGVPLRRHRSDDDANGHNFGGLVDRVLIVRTVLVEYNYDYIFDLVFHQNGAVEVTSRATGYVMTQHYRNSENPFGYRIYDQAVGSIHHHLMNFKVDLDILGTENRYKTMDFTTEKHRWAWQHDGEQEMEQIAFQENLKHTEKEATLLYNFSSPKYYIIYQDSEKNKFGHPRGYRILSDGFSSQLLPKESRALRSRTWTKYQMLVTEHNDVEETSSSIYSMFDGDNPQVDVEQYLQDNASIVDKDLVLWLTIGFHHIPHTEDIPNTPTVGATASISLLPYNYFTECPSVGSRDAVRVEVTKNSKLRWKYGFPAHRNVNCRPDVFDYNAFSSNKSNAFP